MDSYLLHITPEDSKHLFDNTDTDFTVQLPTTLTLGPESYIELCEFVCKLEGNDRLATICILCDLCQPSIVNGKQVPLLRAIMLSNQKRPTLEFLNPYKIKTPCQRVNCFRVYLREADLSELTVELKNVQLTLRINGCSDKIRGLA